MYAVGKPHPLQKPCRSVLEDITQGNLEANINVEVLQELLYVYSSRGERKKGISVVNEILIIFPNPYSIGKSEIVKAKDLMKKHKSLTPRDAVHCATAINNNLKGIISTDKDLDIVKDIKRINP